MNLTSAPPWVWQRTFLMYLRVLGINQANIILIFFLETVRKYFILQTESQIILDYAYRRRYCCCGVEYRSETE